MPEMIMSGRQELEVYNYIVSQVEEEFVLFQLISSLEDDGRFYGAEWQEEMDDWIEYCSYNINSYIFITDINTTDPVEIERRLMESNIDGWISK